MTDKQLTDSNEKSPKEQGVSKPEAQSPAKPETAKQSTMNTPTKKAHKSRTAANLTQSSQKKRSKTAILALLTSLMALGGLGGGYVWQTQQHLALSQELLQNNQQQLAESEAKIQQLIKQQQDNLLAKVEQKNAAQQTSIEQQLSSISDSVASLAQNQPSDWLVHEAEYLISVASRSLWLEQNSTAAINLLKDADTRIKELNDPEFLPVRQAINQDIETLNALPTLATEDVILKLMALTHQISDLPIALAYTPESIEAEENFELTESAADWRENLAKTWNKFLTDFITVKRRTANVEALLTPKQQQSLRHNLQLKIQLVIWATSQQKGAVFDKTLAEVQQWLDTYFDREDLRVTSFYQSIQQLKNEVIELEVPSSLSALKVIRAMIKDKPNQSLIETIPPSKVLPEAELTSPSDDSPKDTQPVIDSEENKENNNGAIL